MLPRRDCHIRRYDKDGDATLGFEEFEQLVCDLKRAGFPVGRASGDGIVSKPMSLGEEQKRISDFLAAKGRLFTPALSIPIIRVPNLNPNLITSTINVGTSRSPTIAFTLTANLTHLLPYSLSLPLAS